MRVRKSKTRSVESEATQDSISGECGDHWAEYVQLFVGRVSSDCGRSGAQTLTVPSQLLEQNRSLDTRFQCTANTSRACSFQLPTGKSATEASKSLTLPSPEAASTWFSCISDHARSKSESCVVNLI